MAKKTVNLGTGPNTLDGDRVRVAFGKINDNFDEVYDLIGNMSSAGSLVNDTHALSLESDGTVSMPGKTKLDSVGNPGQLSIYPNTDDVSYGIKIYISYDNDTHIAPVNNTKGLAIGVSYGAGPHVRMIGQEGYGSSNNGEIVVHAQDFDGNDQSEWIFEPGGILNFPDGGTLRVGAVPASSKGSDGDAAGTLAFDSTYIYYCAEDYSNGSNDIWRRVAWGGDTW